MAEESRGKRVANWGELFERSIELGLGAAMLTAESAQRIVNEMVNRGEVAREESTGLVDRLIVHGREQREQLRETIEKTTERLLERMNVARQDEVAELRQRIDDLESIVMGRAAGAAPPPPPPLEGEDFLVDQE
jgi:polyhydroxyalkanoate synthesis regulator phasin